MDIEKILAKMTLAEKIGQLNQIPFKREDFPILCEKIRRGEVGSLILSSTAYAGFDAQERGYVEMLNALQRIAVEESPSGIPFIAGRDVIHGHEVVFPVPLTQAASFDMEAVEDACAAAAEEAANDGVRWTFAPMLDISRDGRWGRCIEGTGEDPWLASCMARAMVRGFQGSNPALEGRLAACAKHYIGYGASEGGRDYHRTEISDYTLYNTYLPSFRAAVEAGCLSVMSSFNEISGEPVTSSRFLLTDILRGQLGFDGFVVSDWNSILQQIQQGTCQTRAGCAAAAIHAGVDMDMVDEVYLENLAALVENGQVPMTVIDEAVRRILRVKARIGLFTRPYTQIRPIDYKAHEALALKLARESIVLLKNRDHTLPLCKDESVVLLGPMAHEKRALLGSWTLDFDIRRVHSIAEAMESAAPGKITAVQDNLPDRMLSAAIHASGALVLALGESDTVTGESHSMTRLELSAAQTALARDAHALGRKVIGVLCYARPVALEEVEPYFDAILYAGHGGTMAAQAVVQVLYGDYNPSGHLAMTLPRRTGQVPIYYNASSPARTVNGYYNGGYATYEDCAGSAMYPFGYGLSYTDFRFGIPQIEGCLSLSALVDGSALTVRTYVENIGPCAGTALAQCYIHDVCASMARPVRQLCGFTRMTLQPGERREIEFRLDARALGFYLRDGRFTVEPGCFEVYIGGDCLCKNGTAFTVAEDGQ